MFNKRLTMLKGGIFLGKKQIATRIPDSSVWDSFLEHVEQKHGKTHGVLGLELQNILVQYLECPKEDIEALKMENDHLKGLEGKYDQLQGRHDKLRSRYDHLQERLNKSQRELNMLERENSDLRVVVAKIEKMSFFERVLNRLPSEVKELKSGKEDLK